MDRRFIQLFKILAKQKDYAKAEDLCAQLAIRPRTLREDIRQYKDTLESKAGCMIESKPNAGYRLQIFDDELYNAFVKDLLSEESNQQYLIPVNQEERIHYIIRYFLGHSDYVKLNNLADEIYVSRSTLNADIKEVKERLSHFRLKLVSRPGYGLKISGKERDTRSCIAQYFYHSDNYDERYLQELNVHSTFVDQEAFKYIKTILYETISRYSFKLTDFGFQNLSIHLLIAVSRIMGKTYVEDIIKETALLDDQIAQQIANDLALQLNEHFGVHLPASEVHYIAIHLMGKQALAHDSGNLVLETQTMHVTDAILMAVDEYYHVDFKGDLDLYSMLSMHLQPMLRRLQFGLKLDNPMTAQIKKESPLAFEMAVLGCKVIETELNLPIGTIEESEVGYLALHFALAIERQIQPVKKNIVIVCASGAGSSQILLYKIKSKFKDYLNNVLVTEAYHLKNMDLSQFDLILSTIPLDFKTEIPVILVQYFLDDEDVNVLEKVLVNSNQDEQFLKQCFREDLFFTHLSGKTKEEVIAAMIEQIKKVHPLPSDFYQLVLERECISPTEIGNGVAMPHPIHLCMDQTFVAVGILDKPIKWERKSVKFIFMLCIENHSKDALTVFNEALSGFVLNREYINQLDKHPNFDTLKYYIDSLNKEKALALKDSIFQ